MPDKLTKSELSAYLILQKEAQSLLTIPKGLTKFVHERTLRCWLVNAGTIVRIGQKRSTKYRAVQCKPTSAFIFLIDKMLSLGDTHLLLEEGLTVSGKPIKEYQEVIGHASAIELLYRALANEIDESLCFELHKAIQSEVVWDIDKPNSALFK